MKTLSEKITFVLTGLAYLLIHLGKDPRSGSILVGTLVALLNTLPYDIGFTYLAVVFIRRATGGHLPPWDRILRIFFTIGIIFGLVYGLYVQGEREQQRQKKEQVSAARCVGDDSLKALLHWA